MEVLKIKSDAIQEKEADSLQSFYEKVLKYSRADSTIIKEGNSSAHGGNLLVDAMFREGI